MCDWTGIILAGGLGSRLFPLTQDIPKPLVPVCNKAMLDYAIDHLRYAGIKKIIIVLKHLGEKIRDHMEREWFGNPEKLGDLQIQIPHVDSRDTADALRQVSHLIDSDHLLVSMGDIVTNMPMQKFLDYHVQKGGFATISMKTIDEPTQYGVVLLDSEKKIHLFLEKPDSRELYVSSIIQRSDMYLHTNLINTGIYAFNREVLDLLNREGTLMDFGKNVFPYLLENNLPIFGFVEQYYWMDVGQPRPYLWANWDLLRGYGWPITPHGVDHAGLWYDVPPSRGQGCSFDAPASFGENITIGQDSRVSSLSIIGNDVNIGEKTTIEKSVIWNGVNIGKNCSIVESIICDGVCIEDGAALVECVVGPGSTVSKGTTRKYEKITREN